MVIEPAGPCVSAPKSIDGRRRTASVASQVGPQPRIFHVNGRPIHHALVPDAIMPHIPMSNQRDGLVAVEPAHLAVILVTQLNVALSDLQGVL